jgi:putative oxidoreductase
MKIIATIARVLLGCVFVLFGLNIFLQFLPMPPPPSGPAGDFAKALFVSHYIYVVGALQVIGGVLCLAGRFVPLGLTLLGPVIVNILLFHILLNPAGLPMAIIVSVLALIVLWHHRAAFAGLVKSRPDNLKDAK